MAFEIHKYVKKKTFMETSECVSKEILWNKYEYIYTYKANFAATLQVWGLLRMIPIIYIW